MRDLWIDVLDASGCVQADSTGFAVAAAAAIVAALKPTYELMMLGSQGWVVSGVDNPQK